MVVADNCRLQPAVPVSSSAHGSPRVAKAREVAMDQSHSDDIDLTAGFPLEELPEGGSVVGKVGDASVLLVRRGAEVFAVDALCTHYHGPLAEGLLVGDTVRCPWHPACFDLRTGEAVRAPAVSPLACWVVEQQDGKVFVREKRAARKPPRLPAAEGVPARIVIVGGGAAAFAAAERLRREGYEGGIVMISDDDALPVDRPNLSKDYLAGTAPESWVPLRTEKYYAKHGIDLRRGAEA